MMNIPSVKSRRAAGIQVADGIRQEVCGMSTSAGYRSILKALLFLALLTILVLLLALLFVLLFVPPPSVQPTRPTVPTPTHQTHL